jgi:hypothetical protein
MRRRSANAMPVWRLQFVNWVRGFRLQQWCGRSWRDLRSDFRVHSRFAGMR